MADQLTARGLADLFAGMDPDTPVGVQLDPWAPVGRALARIKDDPSGGVIVHLNPTTPNCD